MVAHSHSGILFGKWDIKPQKDGPYLSIFLSERRKPDGMYSMIPYIHIITYCIFQDRKCKTRNTV